MNMKRITALLLLFVSMQATAQTKNNKVTAQETADDLPF